MIQNQVIKIIQYDHKLLILSPLLAKTIKVESSAKEDDTEIFRKEDSAKVPERYHHHHHLLLLILLLLLLITKVKLFR